EVVRQLIEQDEGAVGAGCGGEQPAGIGARGGHPCLAEAGGGRGERRAQAGADVGSAHIGRTHALSPPASPAASPAASARRAARSASREEAMRSSRSPARTAERFPAL